MLLDFTAGPIGQEFLDGDKFIKLIGGPVGGGKSTVALFDLLHRMVNQKPYMGIRRTKFIILRNTAQQLDQTVKPLIDEWLVKRTAGALGSWQLTKKVFSIDFALLDGTAVVSELLLQAADTPDDVQRLLSLEASAAWVEEAREVDPEVFRGLRGRVNRYPNVASGGVTYPGVICSTNPPPSGGFWHDLMVNPPKNTQVYLQPPAILDDGAINPDAENLGNLAPGYYDNLLEGATEEWINVYLRNQFGAGNMGQPIFKSSFKKSFHVSAEPLSAVPQAVNPLLIGMDNGLQAAAVIGQQDMRGRVNILGESYVPADQTMGVESFLDKLLIPKLRAVYPQFRPENILFVLDPACWQRSQVNEETIAMAVGKRGYRAIKASTNSPELRIGAVEGLMVRQIDGKAGLLIDPSCTHLINALEWGYRYKKGTAGMLTTTPEKNHFSHCFVFDTPVSTPKGPIAIGQLSVGDMVHTPQGPRRILATMNHVATQLLELEFDNGTVLSCTPDHPFITDDGHVRADELEYTHVLQTIGLTQCQKQSTPSRFLRALSFTESLRAITKRATKRLAEPSTCTASCGSSTMGKYPQAVTSTILTTTGLITPSATCSAKPLRSIFLNMGSSAHQTLTSLKKCAKLWTTSEHLLPLGTALQKESCGTSSTLKMCGDNKASPHLRAATANASTRGTRVGPSRDSAPHRAKGWLAKLVALTTRHASAAYAARSSKQTNTSELKPAARLVGKKLYRAPGSRVYDLTVEDQHCFYAGGVLVGNCADAFQYFCLHYNTQISGGGYDARSKARPVIKSKYTYA